MTTTATHTKGTKLYRLDTAQSPAQYVAIGQVKQFDPIGGAKSLVDVTNLDSLAREYIPGLQDGDEITVEAVYNSADGGQIDARQSYAAGTVDSWRVDWPDGSRASFQATIMSYRVGGNIDEAISLQMSLKLSGDVTWGSYTV